MFLLSLILAATAGIGVGIYCASLGLSLRDTLRIVIMTIIACAAVACCIKLWRGQ